MYEPARTFSLCRFRSYERNSVFFLLLNPPTPTRDQSIQLFNQPKYISTPGHIIAGDTNRTMAKELAKHNRPHVKLLQKCTRIEIAPQIKIELYDRRNSRMRYMLSS